MTDLTLPLDYGRFLDDLKLRIRTAQVRAALAVNQELVLLIGASAKTFCVSSRNTDGELK